LVAPRCLVGKRPCVRNAETVQHTYRANNTLPAAVDGMVIGSDQHVEADFTQADSQGVGRTELWIAFVRWACQRHLEIADGDVCNFNIGLHTCEARSIVVLPG